MEKRWAAVEIMGRRQHVGLICEEAALGATLCRIEALQRDGSFKVFRYGGAAIFSIADVTESEARKVICAPRGWVCKAFTEPSALPGVCATCGYTAPEHERHAALPAAPEGEGREEDDLPY